MLEVVRAYRRDAGVEAVRACQQDAGAEEVHACRLDACGTLGWGSGDPSAGSAGSLAVVDRRGQSRRLTVEAIGGTIRSWTGCAALLEFELSGIWM